MQVDAVIFGGGAAGLWLLDELSRRGFAVMLLEAGELGRGQTVASQGILHGGLKYTLSGLLTPSAAHIRDMPKVWRECLAGKRSPNLRNTRVRSQSCCVWRTDSVSSRLGMFGARFGLRTGVTSLSDTERPDVLAGCPGTVARVDEQVIAPASFVDCLGGRHWTRVLHIDVEDGLDFVLRGPAQVTAVRLTAPNSGQQTKLQPRTVIFTAGAGNAELRRRVGLTPAVMQRRPLHMVMLRGDLPQLNGHCVDGAKTRVTITSDTDSAGHTVWQLGGQIAEEGVAGDEPSLIARAATELESVIPGLDLSGVEWAAYRIDRAERATHTGKRPDTFQIMREGNVITGWPTKLALVPRLAEVITASVAPRSDGSVFDSAVLSDWPRPKTALPPWETCRQWHTFDRVTRQPRKAA